MTAKPVEWVLDELGAVVDAQPDAHPLWRVDRDNSLIYDGGGTFDMSAAMEDKTDDFKRANFVGARFADRAGEYTGTEPDLDLDEVVGVRVEGYSGGYGHVDPTGQDGVVFQGRDDALVEQIQATLYDALQWPGAGRTNVAFTHLTLTNESPAMAEWSEYHRYDFDVVFDGFEEL
ncbi:hypothetical protein [Halosimplex halophilum]|uniref:hypothetical protein n=1 Tax=Halosimplex halophilum TaxID=2559572 RepID=UPI00107F050D|nr:hypothetical protein [Halosimplex halophilum]